MARPCAWLTSRSPAADDLPVRAGLAVQLDLAARADLALKVDQADQADQVPLVVPARAQVLPLLPPPKRAAPVRANLLWSSQAPTLA
jgi:hypothetical protein